MAPESPVPHLFISHFHGDSLVAEHVKDVLSRAGVAKTFLDAHDIRPGDPWESAIRKKLVACDAIVTILTPEFASRLWMSAEWASFWMAEKPTYVLRLDVPLDKVFAPMKGSQLADLGSVTSMAAFLDVVAPTNPNNHHLARSLVERVETARLEQRKSDTETMLNEIVRREAIVKEARIAEAIDAGLTEQLLTIHERKSESGANLNADRLNKIALALLQSGVPSGQAIELTKSIGNSNYQGRIVQWVIGGPDSVMDRRAFADALFNQLTVIARQRVVARAHELGFELSDRWEGIPPFGD
jgi:hypothetical protein